MCHQIQKDRGSMGSRAGRSHRGLLVCERGLKLGSLGPELVITIGSLFPQSRLKEAGLSALPVSDP